MKDIITVSHLNFEYQSLPVLSDICFNVGQGEFFGLIGPNGAGKSTLLKILIGLLQPSSGTVNIAGQAAHACRRWVGYVPQVPTLVRHFPITVEQVVLSSRLGNRRWVWRYNQNDRHVAQHAMEQTRTWQLRTRAIATLSGGELQRVLLARALACEPKWLALDEPTANIDQHTEHEIFELLRELKMQMSIVLISHDIGMIKRYTDRVGCLNRSLFCIPSRELDGEIINRLYSRHDARLISQPSLVDRVNAVS